MDMDAEIDEIAINLCGSAIFGVFGLAIIFHISDGQPIQSGLLFPIMLCFVSIAIPIVYWIAVCISRRKRNR